MYIVKLYSKWGNDYFPKKYKSKSSAIKYAKKHNGEVWTIKQRSKNDILKQDYKNNKKIRKLGENYVWDFWYNNFPAHLIENVYKHSKKRFPKTLNEKINQRAFLGNYCLLGYTKIGERIF